ncbi:hypothetical protein DL96DRAFT_650669 [Flagelloscypha sp. PMI_526]|nr:hypothetical protein DL96DRAFT_650669 [Flagelloscypha sp. PMI_526]
MLIFFGSRLGCWRRVGTRKGASHLLAVSISRLRINSILNSVTRRGTFIGNSAGVLALAYNGVNSTIDAYRGKTRHSGQYGCWHYHRRAQQVYR